MEIDWSKAPEWAEFHAIDGLGTARWYEKEPKAKFAHIGKHPRSGFFVPSGGKYCEDKEGSINAICMNWENSLKRKYKKEYYL